MLARAHAWSAPLESDECNYAYIGSRLLAGERLYVDVWDHQPPGVYWLFAATAALGGDRPSSYRVLGTCFTLVTLVLLWQVMRRTLGPLAAVMGAGMWALTCSDPLLAGDGVNREIYMNTLAVGALACLAPSREPVPGLRRVVAAGGLLGAASLLKTVAAAQWVALAAWLAWVARGQRKGPLPVKVVAAFAIGPLMLWGLTTAGYALTGRAGAFFDAVFVFNLGYAAGESLPARLGGLVRHADALGLCWPVVVLAACGALFVRWGPVRRAGWLFVALLAGSAAAVALPGRYWGHYYYLLLPGLILMAGPLWAFLDSYLRSRRAGWVVAAVVLGVVAWPQVQGYWLQPGEMPVDNAFRRRMVWAREQGLRIGRVTEPGQSIYVWGTDVGLYYYSRRRCASRFTMNTALREGQHDYARRRAVLMADLERSRPAMVFLTEPEFEALARFLREGYFLIGADVDERRQATRMWVFQRRDLYDPTARREWPVPVVSGG